MFRFINSDKFWKLQSDRIALKSELDLAKKKIQRLEKQNAELFAILFGEEYGEENA